MKKAQHIPASKKQPEVDISSAKAKEEKHGHDHEHGGIFGKNTADSATQTKNTCEE